MPDIDAAALPDLAVAMVRETLDDLPRHPLPPEFALRPYQPGDKEAWRRIHLLADRWQPIPATLFTEQFGKDPRPLRERQFYLCADGGEAVGTATAWWLDDYRGRAWGRVHWVAIEPGFQGRGLAKPLLGAVLERLRELGHERALLTTATVRLPAINLYLRFGFRPEPRDGREAEAWKMVMAALRKRPRA